MRLPDSALRWLETILLERFGFAVRLQYAEDERVQLLLPELAGGVMFPAHHDFFLNGSSAEIPFAWQLGMVADLASPVGDVVPMPGEFASRSSLISEDGQLIYFDYDLFGMIYWALARVEELVPASLDAHGRFPAAESHAVKHGYLDRPVVDEWLHVLAKLLKHKWPQLVFSKREFRTLVSHDVDHPTRYGFLGAKAFVRRLAADFLRSKDFRLPGVALRSWLATPQRLHHADPFNCFDWIMDISDENGLKSAFYFVTNGSHPLDGRYPFDSAALRGLIRRVADRGHEIGLHPSYLTYDNPELLVSEAERLKRLCSELGINQDRFGGRMHFLRWEWPATLRAWNAAGMAYDSTLGYAAAPGFRCGTCIEYPAYDPVRGEMLDIRIRPLVVMETSIFKYMDLGADEQAYSLVTKLKDVCRKVNGDFVFLWHNSAFVSDSQRDLYRALLRH